MSGGSRPVLAGDVGGTHARLAVFEVGGGMPRLVTETVYASAEYDGLESVVAGFLRQTGTKMERGCIAVAGPVEDGVYRFPNLGWQIRVEGFGARVGIPRVGIINDFEAVGYGIPALEPGHILTLQEGHPRDRGPLALIGAGTGLGEGYLVWEDGEYVVHASEGGHADFAPGDRTQELLLGHLRERYGHVSWERVVSGQGLTNVYEFLRDSGVAEETGEVRREMESGEDPAEVVSRHAVRGEDPLCSEALGVFVRAFGAQAGNLALTLGATGGVYVAGGIAPKILDVLRAGPFLEAFKAKGRLRELMEEFPVRVVTNDAVGLLGAAAVAARS
jgi:glucokinase